METQVQNHPYTDLTYIGKATKWDIADHAKALLALFSNYSALGICRLHKHFEIAQNEFVVSMKEGSDSYRTQVTFRNEDYIPWQWKFDHRTQQWVPIEYFKLDCETKQKFSKIDQTEVAVYFEQAAIYLNCQGEELTNQVGLALNMDFLTNIERKAGQFLLETTNTGKRIQLSKPVTKDQLNQSGMFATVTRWYPVGYEACACRDSDYGHEEHYCYDHHL